MSDSPDIRVRLSAEGVDEVVRALERVKAASQKAGNSGKSFGMLNQALGDLKGLLPALGIGAAVTGLVAMTKHALEAADNIGKLSQKTGFSTKTLSVLNVAAELADASIESMSKGLAKFNKGMGELDEGSATAGDSVRRLFGSSKALEGLNTEERFFKVAQAIGGMESGYKKTKAAQDFFGKSGAELIPLLDDLANGGFEEAAKKAQKLGLIIDQDLAKNAQIANDNMKELKMATEGAAIQFASGLAPALSDATKALTDSFTAAGSSNNGLKLVGEGVGWLVKVVVFGFELIGKTLGTGLAAWGEFFGALYDITRDGGDIVAKSFSSIGSALREGLHGNISEAGKELKKISGIMEKDGMEMSQRAADRVERVLSMFSNLKSEVGKNYAGLFGPKTPEAEGKKPKNGGGGGEPDAAAQKAMLDLMKARLDQQLALTNRYLALDQQRATQAYEQGKRSLAEYYDERRRILTRELDGEIAELEAKKKLASRAITNNAAEEIAKKAQIEAIDAQIDQKKVDRTAKLEALAFDRQQKEEAFAKRRVEIENQILTAQGRTYEAALKSIQLQAEELKKAGVDPETIKNLSSSLTRQAKVQDLQRTGGNALAGIDTMKVGLDNQVAGGALFPLQALQQYQAAIREVLPDLQALAASQREAAATPEEILAAEQFTNQVNALGIQADETALQMAQFKQNVESALTSDLTNFFTTGISEAENFGDAMRGLALSVVDSLRQIAAQMLANIAMQQLMKAATSFGFSGGGLVAGYASGGVVTGPGNGTSDSIPARLSAGEFVVRSAVVKQPGVLESLVALNQGMGRANVAGRGAGIPRFAEGGLVTAGEAMGGMSLEANFGLDEGVITKKMKAYLKSSDGQRVQIENLSANQKRASRALGR